MAWINFGNWIWEGLSNDPKPTKAQGANDGHGHYLVTFVTPFSNEDYSVTLSVMDSSSATPIPSFLNITMYGFDIYSRNSRSGQLVGNVTISWLATKNYNP
jgi:hypothetical protein